MVFIIGLLISNVAIAIALPPSPHFTHLLNNIPELNKALIKDPDLLSNTRLTDITLKGVVLKNGTIKNTRWRNVEFDNPVFENVEISNGNWFGIRFRNMKLKQVTFDDVFMAVNKSVIYDNTSDHGGNTNFSYGVMDKVVFKNSILKAVEIEEFKHSDITFSNIKMVEDPKSRTDNTSKYSSVGYIQGQLHFLNSEMSQEVSSLRYPSEVFIDNSKMKGVSGHLKRIEIKNSEFAGQAGSSADYVFIENTVGDVSLYNARFAHLVNNRLDYAEINGTQNVLFENCQTPSYYSIDNAQNLMIRNCMIDKLFMNKAQVGNLTWCDVTFHSQGPSNRVENSVWDQLWDKANIRELDLYNVQISGDYPTTKDITIGIINKDESTILPSPFLQTAQKQGVLTTCPPRPNVEQLKQQALAPSHGANYDKQ